jgi:hypothetical protein
MAHDAAISPQADGDEARMRRNLGLDTAFDAVSTKLPLPTDPMKIARQAIRSQAAARDYAERQLVRAEAIIQDLRSKLHQAHQEKGAAVEAARLAGSRKATAERTLIATETTLTAEKEARDRGDRELRELQARTRDLQERLDIAAQGLKTIKPELVAERQARRQAEDALREATSGHRMTERLVEVAVAEPNRSSPPARVTAKGRRGRPPRAIEVVRPVRKLDRPEDPSKVAVPPDRGEAASTVRRPVGRPRKMVQVKPIQTSDESTGKAQAFPKIVSEKAEKPNGRGRRDEQKPVQWWIEGWNRRGA